MNFQRGRHKDEPEINLVPIIDVLLVILIFLVITTTYSKFAELEINLPQSAVAETDTNVDRPSVIDVSIDAAGKYAINDVPVVYASIEGFQHELRTAAGDEPEPIIIINADAKASHQAVITVMEAARMAGYNKITFTTETDIAE